MDYKISGIKRKDSHSICRLYEEAFSQPMCKTDSQSIFLWFYFNNLYNRNYCMKLENRNELLSYWGFIPIDCIVRGEILKCSLSFQLASKEKILGSTFLLWKKINKDLINNNVALNFTINHENSSLLLQRLGWKTVKNPILIKMLRPFLLINDLLVSKIKIKLISKFFSAILILLDCFLSKFILFFQKKYRNVISVKSFSNQYNDIWMQMRKSIDFGVCLDYSYMNWRYKNKPNNNYHILSYRSNGKVEGYLIYSVEKIYGTSIGYIMDIIANPKNKVVIDSLIKYTIKELFRKKVRIISALSFNNNIFYHNFKTTGFNNVPNLMLPHKSYFSVFNNLIDNNFELNQWHISWGNHDNH